MLTVVVAAVNRRVKLTIYQNTPWFRQGKLQLHVSIKQGSRARNRALNSDWSGYTVISAGISPRIRSTNSGILFQRMLLTTNMWKNSRTNSTASFTGISPPLSWFESKVSLDWVLRPIRVLPFLIITSFLQKSDCHFFFHMSNRSLALATSTLHQAISISQRKLCILHRWPPDKGAIKKTFRFNSLLKIKLNAF